MLKLTLKPGDYIDIGENIRVVFSGGSANNIHLLVDAPREMNIARSSAERKSNRTHYYKEQGISESGTERDRCNSDEGAPQQIRRSKVIRSG